MRRISSYASDLNYKITMNVYSFIGIVAVMGCVLYYNYSLMYIWNIAIHFARIFLKIIRREGQLTCSSISAAAPVSDPKPCAIKFQFD